MTIKRYVIVFSNFLFFSRLEIFFNNYSNISFSSNFIFAHFSKYLHYFVIKYSKSSITYLFLAFLFFFFFLATLWEEDIIRTKTSSLVSNTSPIKLLPYHLASLSYFFTFVFLFPNNCLNYNFF